MGKRVLLFINAALVLAMSCAGPEEDTLDFDEYRSRFVEYSAPLSGWVLEGDLLVQSESDIYEMYLKSTGRQRRGKRLESLTVLTRNGTDVVWPKPVVLSYCVSSDLTINTQVLADHLQEAAKSWSDVADVRFEDRSLNDFAFCGPASDVVFEVRRMPPGQNGYAVAFWPDEPRSARKLYFSDIAFALTPTQLQAVVRHEVGHILGFRHENLWSGCGGETPAIPPYDARQVTSLDTFSVMNSTRCAQITTQTASDIAGARTLYGFADAGTWTEHAFSPLSSTLTPVAVGSATNRFDLFSVSAVGEVQWAALNTPLPLGFNSLSWSGLGEFTTQKPAAFRLAASVEDLDLFVVNNSGMLRHAARRSGSWSWESLGAVSCGVTAAELPGGGMVVSSCRQSGTMIVPAIRVFNGSGWLAWEQPSSALTFGTPQVAAWPDGQIHFLSRGKFNAIAHWTRSAAGVWTSLALGTSAIVPPLLAPYQGRLVASLVNAGAVSVASFNGVWATTPLSSGLLATGDVSVVYIDGAIEVFAQRSADSAYYRNRIWRGLEMGWSLIGSRSYSGSPAAFSVAAGPVENRSPFLVGSGSYPASALVLTRTPY